MRFIVALALLATPALADTSTQLYLGQPELGPPDLKPACIAFSGKEVAISDSSGGIAVKMGAGALIKGPVEIHEIRDGKVVANVFSLKVADGAVVEVCK